MLLIKRPDKITLKNNQNNYNTDYKLGRQSEEKYFQVVSKSKDNKDVNHNFHPHLKNLIDKQHHYDYVAFNEKWYNTNWQMQNINEMLSNLLYNFTVAKNLVGDNILIWFADHVFENKGQATNFIEFLNENNINHLNYETESLMKWVTKNNYTLGADQMHPSKETYELFYQKYILPKIK